jgi:hypothetical protein
VRIALFSGLLFLSGVQVSSAAKVSLAWDTDPDPTVVGYKVYYGATSGVYTNSIDVGDVTSATLSNLVDGVTYYFSATAYDTTGLESDYSAEVVGAMPSPNAPPTLNAITSFAVNEGAPLQTVNLSGITSGSTNELQTLTVTASSSNPGLIPTPAVSYSSPNTTGTLTFTPVALGFGSSVITVTVNDGSASNNIVTRTFTVTVNPVNTPPTLDALTSVTINENALAQSVGLTGISSGAPNETQTLTVTATSSNPSLIPNPTVTYTSPNAAGSIAFAPVFQGFGSAVISVSVNDGGTSNNIVIRTFTVTVNAVNQVPTLNAPANVTMNENAAPQNVSLAGIGAGAANETQTLTVTATSSNPALIPNPTVSYSSPNTTGSLSVAPVATMFGSAVISVTVNDGGTSNNVITRTFNVTVNPVNQPPTLDTPSNLSINENAGVQTVGLTGISSGAANETQTLVVTASSSNPSLIPAPTVTYSSPSATGSLSFKPVTNTFGNATITVTVNDGGTSNNIVTRTFSVAVGQVNTAPTITAIPDQTVVVGNSTAAIPFTVGDLESAASTLTLSAGSDNPGLVPTGNVTFGGSAANRTVTISPVGTQGGVANLTVTVSDGFLTANRVFKLTVRARPASPTNLRIAKIN